MFCQEWEEVVGKLLIWKHFTKNENGSVSGEVKPQCTERNFNLLVIGPAHLF